MEILKEKLYEEWLERYERWAGDETINNYKLEEKMTSEMGDLVDFVFSEQSHTMMEITTYYFHLKGSPLFIDIARDIEYSPYEVGYRILTKRQNYPPYEAYHFPKETEEELKKLAEITKKCIDVYLSQPNIRLIEATNAFTFEYDNEFAPKEYLDEMKKLL